MYIGIRQLQNIDISFLVFYSVLQNNVGTFFRVIYFCLHTYIVKISTLLINILTKLTIRIPWPLSRKIVTKLQLFPLQISYKGHAAQLLFGQLLLFDTDHGTKATLFQSWWCSCLCSSILCICLVKTNRDTRVQQL